MTYETMGKDAERHGDVNKEDECGDAHEDKQRDVDEEGRHGGEDEYDPQTDTDEGKRRDMNEMDLTDHNQQKNKQKKDEVSGEEVAGRIL